MSYAYADLFLLINGEKTKGHGALLQAQNPATHEVIGQFNGASEEDIDAAAAAAENAFSSWGSTLATEREQILKRTAQQIRDRSEEIAVALVTENGKPLAEARAEVGAAADTVDFYAGEARRAYGRTIPTRVPHGRMLTMQVPVGVVAAFTPWNFPAINLVRKLAPAIGAGCTVVVKPAEETPATALLIAACFAAAGLPPGVLNVIYGDPAQISSRLIASDYISKISFTGSTGVGRTLARQAGGALKRMTMELGNHAPVIVCADADPEAAADKASAAKFRNAGQTCNSASRFLVHASIHERFTQRFAENARRIKVGNGLDPATTMGPLSNGRRVLAIQSMVEDAAARGARLLAGGKPLEGKGNFFEPTVLSGVPPDARVMQEEPFGPIAPIVSFERLEDAIALANSTRYALASYVISDHAPTIRLLTAQIKAGMVGVNTFVAALPETPFGGLGHSGWGQEGGPEGMAPYLHTRFINEN